jgi:DNA invertase Pin-like site-specific DNA recombinase
MSATPTVAYSYIRFSSSQQAEGDSLRRQTELAEAYCRRRGWTLDANLTLRDLGVSARRGRNALVGNLGVFLDAIRTGKVQPGSALIVESVDRISRQGIDEGYDTIKRILKAGVRLVTLAPEREYGPEAVKSLTKGALELQLILERAAEESEMKSQRIGAAWREKKEDARAHGTPFGSKLPAWLELQGGEFRLIPERAATVKLIYALAAAGYGCVAIVRKLISDGVKPFGEKVVRPGKKRGVYGGKWIRQYVANILGDRRAVGEYQPTRGEDRQPDGPPVPGYYPAAVSEREYALARAGAISRRTGGPSRQGKHVNLFPGMVKDARDGEPFDAVTRAHGRKSQRALANRAGRDGRGPYTSFPLVTFEREILGKLREIDPAEIIGNGKDRPDEVAVLTAEKENAEAKLAKVEAELLAGPSTTLAKVARQLEGQLNDLTSRLKSAQAAAAHPLEYDWGEFGGLAEALESAADPIDARLRLRAVLHRLVDEITLLVVPRGRARLAAVQVWFTGDGHRDYLILHRPPVNNGKVWVEGGSRSWSLADVATLGPLDLRQPADVKKLEAALLALDLDVLVE